MMHMIPSNGNHYLLQKGNIIRTEFEDDETGDLEVIRIFNIEKTLFIAVRPVGSEDVWFYKYSESQGSYILSDIEDDYYDYVEEFYNNHWEDEELIESEDVVFDDSDYLDAEIVRLLRIRKTQNGRRGLFSRPEKYSIFTWDKEKKYEAKYDYEFNDVNIEDTHGVVVGTISVGSNFTGKRYYSLSVNGKYLGDVNEKAIVRHKYYVEYRDMELDGSVFSSRCVLRDNENNSIMTAKATGEGWELEYNDSLQEVEAILLFLIQLIPCYEEKDDE